MNIDLKPIKADSLKEIFISQFEELILSGTFPIGEKLPSERDLAEKLGVSRPVVHEGLVDLAHKGLVTMVPRIGTVVNDYRRLGSLPLLNSLVKYQKDDLDPKMLKSLLELRMHFEIEFAILAAARRTEESLVNLREIIIQESKINRDDIESVVEMDFQFHLNVAIATENLAYPLLINSFKQVYTSVTARFFTDPNVIDFVFQFHKKIVQAIEDKNIKKAEDLMAELLSHGENNLLAIKK